MVTSWSISLQCSQSRVLSKLFGTLIAWVHKRSALLVVHNFGVAVNGIRLRFSRHLVRLLSLRDLTTFADNYFLATAFVWWYPLNWNFIFTFEDSFLIGYDRYLIDLLVCVVNLGFKFDLWSKAVRVRYLQFGRSMTTNLYTIIPVANVPN